MPAKRAFTVWIVGISFQRNTNGFVCWCEDRGDYASVWTLTKYVYRRVIEGVGITGGKGRK